MISGGTMGRNLLDRSAIVTTQFAPVASLPVLCIVLEATAASTSVALVVDGAWDELLAYISIHNNNKQHRLCSTLLLPANQGLRPLNVRASLRSSSRRSRRHLTCDYIVDRSRREDR